MLPNSPTRPSVIFLDAVGTLFGVRDSVGDIYSEIARQFGVDVPASVLNQAFFQQFKAAGSPAFAPCDPAELQAQEFNWWMKIAIGTFRQVGALAQFTDFSAFFSILYEHFATADPWIVYPDVVPALTHWQANGISLGIVSNFDSRIYPVLEALALKPLFNSITISTEAGVAKPDPTIFAIALQKHQCLPQAAWHIGDSYQEDYQTAREAGLRGIWLRRKDYTNG
jgi:putative hydrolase of the HAD superfamily